MFRATRLLLAVAFAAFLMDVATMALFQESQALLNVTDIAVAVAALAVAAGFFLAYNLAPKWNFPLEREYLLWTSLAFLFFMLGDMVWAYLEVARGVELPLGSFPDLFWSLAYALLFVAISKALLSTEALEGVLAPGIIRFSFALAVFYFAFHANHVASGAHDAVILIQDLYPLYDILLLSFLLVLAAPLVQSLKWGFFSTPAGLFSLALFSRILFDLAFAVLNQQGAYSTGHFVDVFYSLSYVLAALSADRHFARYEDDPGKSALGTPLPSWQGL